MKKAEISITSNKPPKSSSKSKRGAFYFFDQVFLKLYFGAPKMTDTTVIVSSCLNRYALLKSDHLSHGPQILQLTNMVMTVGQLWLRIAKLLMGIL
jgi:hypothetical protein